MLPRSKLTKVASSLGDNGVEESKYETTGRGTVYRDFELEGVSVG